MTTPENFRRRQRVEGALLLLLGVFTILVSIYFRGEADAQRECINDYFAANSATSAIRSDQVERESRATRRFLLNATDPDKIKTREQFLRERSIYARALHSIDAARAANPVQPFPKGLCD